MGCGPVVGGGLGPLRVCLSFFLGTITGLSRTEAQRTIFAGLAGRQRMDNARMVAVFSFLYFLKIKISKIYIRFEIFQKYTPVALP